MLPMLFGLVSTALRGCREYIYIYIYSSDLLRIAFRICFDISADVTVMPAHSAVLAPSYRHQTSMGSVLTEGMFRLASTGAAGYPAHPSTSPLIASLPIGLSPLCG